MRFSDADAPGTHIDHMDDVDIKRQRDAEGRSRPSRFSDASVTVPPQVAEAPQTAATADASRAGTPAAASAPPTAPAVTVKTEPEKPINPAAIPLLQQLALMLKKGKK
jgi:hypothetical protein